MVELEDMVCKMGRLGLQLRRELSNVRAVMVQDQYSKSGSPDCLLWTCRRVRHMNFADYQPYRKGAVSRLADPTSTTGRWRGLRNRRLWLWNHGLGTAETANTKPCEPRERTVRSFETPPVGDE